MGEWYRKPWWGFNVQGCPLVITSNHINLFFCHLVNNENNFFRVNPCFYTLRIIPLRPFLGNASSLLPKSWIYSIFFNWQRFPFLFRLSFTYNFGRELYVQVGYMTFIYPIAPFVKSLNIIYYVLNCILHFVVKVLMLICNWSEFSEIIFDYK